MGEQLLSVLQHRRINACKLVSQLTTNISVKGRKEGDATQRPDTLENGLFSQRQHIYPMMDAGAASTGSSQLSV